MLVTLIYWALWIIRGETGLHLSHTPCVILLAPRCHFLSVFSSLCLATALYLAFHLSHSPFLCVALCPAPLSIYLAVSLSHVCRPCQQNGWQTVFISILKDVRPAWQLWELSTGIRQSPPCRKAAAACSPSWQPFWARLFGAESVDIYAALSISFYLSHFCYNPYFS